MLGAGAFWSLGGLLIRLVQSAPPWQILFYRSAALALFFLVLIMASGSLGRLRAGGAPLVLAGVCTGTAFTGFVFALTHTTVANTFFLFATQPFITALLAWGVVGERPEARTWLAMTAALAGVGCMVLDGLEQGTLFGNAMALAAATGFAGLTVTLRVNRTLDMRPGIALGGLFAAALAAVVLAGGEAEPVPHLLARFRISIPDLALCVTSGTVQIGCGMLLYALGTRRVSANEAALLALSEVVLAPLWVWLVIAERPSGYTLVGGAVLLGGLGLRVWPAGATRRAVTAAEGPKA